MPTSEMASIQMPRYQCHKKVWALKIMEIRKTEPVNHDPKCESDGCEGGALLIIADEGYAPIKVDAAYLRKHRPQAGGYYVVYDDGYKSFSPAQAFQEGYTRI